MTECSSGVVTADQEWCYSVVQDVSRTFALTIAELDEPLSREICVGYLLCRVADTIEDSTHIPPCDQVELLKQYRVVLESGSIQELDVFMSDVESWVPDSPNADWRVVSETPRVFRAFQSLPSESQAEIRPWVEEMVEGMEMFIERYADEGGLRVETFGELEEYCWYVAGTVGHLVTGLVSRDVSGETEEVLYERAGSFGLLLQLVNVAKDVAVDYDEENNVYVPEELLSEHGLDTSDIEVEEEAESFEPVVGRIVDEAESHIDDAQHWLRVMPGSRGNTLSAWAIPFLLAVATIRELKERPADVITQGDVRVAREEVFALLNAFSGDGQSSVEEVQQEIRRSPFGQD